ncbi:N-acetylmuramoyl-L-alanine amidase [Nonomuraea bangladeshensis]|uniref:peptidoglycan recognition protein family protein n=1 Tax=Nonomuraea bangladeshensis TaxID=404385 RepID=UPI003C30D707
MRIVPRAEFGWGSSGAAYARPTRGLVIHYDGSNQGLAGKPHSACMTYWRATRRFHMGAARGWADIGYSFGACPHGYLFEGRGLNKAQAAQPSGNTTWYSCTLMSGPDEQPTPEQINAVRELRAWLMSRGVAGTVKGHRDFYSTSCPGDALYRMVKDGTFAKKPEAASSPAEAADSASWMETIVNSLPLLKPAADNYDVKTARAALFARGYLPENVYAAAGLQAWLEKTVYDDEMVNLIRGFQKLKKLDVDGLCGPQTWRALLRVS